MANQRDPTRTISLRKNVAAEINRRFNRIRAQIRLAFPPQSEVLGVMIARNAADDGYVFVSRPDADILFRAWLQRQIDAEILQTADGIQPRQSWLRVPIDLAYSKGATTAERKYRTAKKVSQPSVVFEFLSPLQLQAHRERAAIIHRRAFDSLKGVTSTMADQMANIITDGVLKGEHPYAIGQQLNDRIDKIGKVRSRLIARTEIIRAHQVGTIETIERNAPLLGDDNPRVIWNTKQDGKARDEHQSWNGKTYTTAEALSMGGAPNCRCSVSPFIPELDDPAVAAEIKESIKQRRKQSRP